MNTSLTDHFPLSRSELLSPIIFCLLLPCLKQLNPVIVVSGSNVQITSGQQTISINVLTNPSNQGNNQNPNPNSQTIGQGTGQSGQSGQASGSISPSASNAPSNQQSSALIPTQPQGLNQRPNMTGSARPPASFGSSTGSSTGNASNSGMNVPANIGNSLQVTSSPRNQNVPKTFKDTIVIDKITGNPGTSLYLQGNSRKRLAKSKDQNHQNKRPIVNSQRIKITLSNDSIYNLQRRVNTRNGVSLNRRLVQKVTTRFPVTRDSKDKSKQTKGRLN